MKRNVKTFKGLIFDYFVCEFSSYPYTKWVWQWGMFAFSHGRKVCHILGQSDTKPKPSLVFPNLLPTT